MGFPNTGLESSGKIFEVKLLNISQPCITTAISSDSRRSVGCHWYTSAVGH